MSNLVARFNRVVNRARIMNITVEKCVIYQFVKISEGKNRDRWVYTLRYTFFKLSTARHCARRLISLRRCLPNWRSLHASGSRIASRCLCGRVFAFGRRKNGPLTLFSPMIDARAYRTSCHRCRVVVNDVQWCESDGQGGCRRGETWRKIVR